MLRRVCKLLGFKFSDFEAADSNSVFAQGNTVPAYDTSGYAVGCIFAHRDGGAGTSLYVNEGSESSCNFKPLVAGITASAAEINNAADVSARVQELTASGTVTAGVQSVELNHGTVVVAAAIADASNHQGLFIVKDTSASGTAAHTLTLTSGTFNGTNNVATLNAPKEALVVYFDSAGNGTIVENIGSVALS